MTTYVAVYACENMHVTRVEIIDAWVEESGEVTGFSGSSADFCDVCDSGKMTCLGVQECDEGI